LSSTILAFDFGLKRIGVAVGNSILKQAQPLTIITAATNDDKFSAIAQLVREWEPDLAVVGMPLHPDGAEHEMSVRCRRFANQLHGRFGLATILVDERYSSAVLSQQRGELIDDQAAAIILQQFFDQHDPS
jgi:putative Holliday junction resolvase